VIAISLAVVLSNLGGDPVENILGPYAPKAEVAAERHKLGLDRPLVVQVGTTLAHVVQGDLGTSLRYQRPCLRIILDRVPASFELMAGALLLGILLGVPLGVIAALRAHSLVDRLVMSVAVGGYSVPLYWLSMIAVLVFSLNLHWFPAALRGGFDHLVLPVCVLATYPLGRIARITRSSMSDVLGEEYILAARARGLGALRVVIGHGLRNAALPVVTMVGLLAGVLLSSAVTVEAVFAWPGIGSLAVEAVSYHDFRLVQAVVIFGAIVFVGINFAVDMLYGILDPRIKAQVR
jgi:peptide/nickel transport system permease protein